jgi:hypothetical protein
MDKTFSDFAAKNSPEATDMVVGYEAATQQEIRIPVSALAGADGASVELQFSASGTSWHNVYAASDRYMRTRVGAGSWSAAIPIGDNAVKMANIPEITNVGENFIVVVTASGLRRISKANLNAELNVSVPIKRYIGFKEAQDGDRTKFTTMQEFVPWTTELYLNGQ